MIEMPQADGANRQMPSLECDLIMKGGITSGVVFPKALVALSRQYRFRSIGGTSAGAIAAVVAAAAEYCRQTKGDNSGFDKIAALPQDLGQNLGGLFQPSPKLAPLFELGLAALEGKASAVALLRRKLLPARWLVAAATLPGIAVMFMAPWAGNPLGIGLAILLGLLIAAVGVAALVVRRVAREGVLLAGLVTDELPKEDFGLCPGRWQSDPEKLGFTDWIHAQIQDVAGKKGRPPLTLGELKKSKIEVAAVTTDLSSQRPYQLPIKLGVHYFSVSEFRELFPCDVVDYLVANSDCLKDGFTENGKTDLRALPPHDDWPLLLLARMSLSFPFLIRAVPLYRYDYTLRRPEDRKRNPVKRCLFSDGGITSNFPIHFFDGWLPSRPTFGISLSDYDLAHYPFWSRLLWRRNAASRAALKVGRIDSLPAFIFAMFDSARNWQEMLQSQLHGYSDRIVEIRLDSTEGGLNLKMDPQVVSGIADLGGRAGEKIVRRFDFQEHRWRRAVSMLYRASEQLIVFGDREEQLKYTELIDTYQPKSFGNIANDPAQRKEYSTLVRDLAEIGRALGRRKTDESGNLTDEFSNTLQPPSDEITNLRITPSIDSHS